MVLKVWNQADRCGGCNHCGMDMDMDPFCVHPTVAKEHPIGLRIGQAVAKYCGGEGDSLKLWEKRVER